MRSAVTPILLLTFLIMSSAAHAQRGDNILMKDGKTERGEILKVAPDAITVMIRQRETPIKVSNIRTITFEKEPSDLRSVRDALRDGQLDQAAERLDRIDPSKISGSDFVKQDVAFLAARLKALQAKEGSATPNEAIAAMKQFASQNPQSWRLGGAMESLGELAMQTADYKTAASMFARLGKMSTGVDKLKSNVRSGDALRAMKDTKNAMSMYSRVIKAQTTNADEERQKQMALVGAMSVAAASGQADKAIVKLKKVIADNDASDMELFGRAYNALGDCYRAANKPTDAALAYLHTDLLFYRDANVHAESLHHLSKLWGDLGKTERSRQAKGMLKQAYPTSPWAK